MKKDLQDLIKRAESLEEYFHLDFALKDELLDDKISDVPVFQEWLQALIYELGELNEDKKSEYIAGTLLLINNGFHGGRDRKDFITLHGRLKVIESNIDSFYPENEVETGKESHSTMKPKIFISHSTKDKEYAKAFVDLLSAIGLDSEQLFCSSLPAFDIPVGNDIFDYLLKQFSAYHLHMVFLHSANYYASPIALNEMGAAWALRSEYTSFLLPGFNFEDMKAVVKS